MSLWCSILGHNYSVTSTYGNYAFCSRCGSPLTIKEPHVLIPGERRWIDGNLMEMTEIGLEEVEKDVRQILKEDTITKEAITEGNENGKYAVQSKDPHEQ